MGTGWLTSSVGTPSMFATGPRCRSVLGCSRNRDGKPCLGARCSAYCATCRHCQRMRRSTGRRPNIPKGRFLTPDGPEPCERSFVAPATPLQRPRRLSFALPQRRLIILKARPPRRGCWRRRSCFGLPAGAARSACRVRSGARRRARFARRGRWASPAACPPKKSSIRLCSRASCWRRKGAR
jgi:hypothetical protein